MRVVLEAAALDPARRPLEVVERKGVGHPDTLCDAAADAFSRGLSRRFLERTGRILHHNVDKALLIAGETQVRFGGGEWIASPRFVLAGRAPARIDGETVPLEEIARAAVREAIAPVRHLPPERVDCEVRVRSGAPELRALVGVGSEGPRANDTSFGVGFAPRSATERVALRVEALLNDPGTKRAEPALGEDVKVMAVRDGDRLALTIAVAMVAGHLPDASAYARATEFARASALGAARELGFERAEVHVNAGDVPERSWYLTLSGTSAESGDDGQVGRGNRLSGLITPMRPMTLEAWAGKNPVAHVGKLLQAAATDAAEALAALPGVRAAECLLLSEIGAAVASPRVAGVRLDAAPDAIAALDGAVRDVVERVAAALPMQWRRWIEGPPG